MSLKFHLLYRWIFWRIVRCWWTKNRWRLWHLFVEHLEIVSTHSHFTNTVDNFVFFFFDAAFIIAISPLPFIFFRLIKVNWKLWQLLLRWIQLFGARSRVEQLIKVRIQYSVVTSYLLIREYFRQNAYKCYILYYSWRRVFFFFWKIISILQIICILKYFMQYNHNAIQMQYNAL